MEEDQQQHTPNSPNQSTERSEPVRSRWTPKPEQILILESIFNSGMVNPPKDETVRIRKLLEKFGTVGDANVFYWFQNRRSRSRRRQRQMQAAALGGANVNNSANSSASAAAATAAMGFGGSSYLSAHASFISGGLPSSCGGAGSGQEGLSGFFSGGSTHQMGLGLFPQIDHTSAATSSVLYPSDAPNLNFQTGVGFGAGTNISGFITVFINGIATEVPRGPLDLKTVFGENVMLVHSSGGSVPTNEFGFLMQSLQHGESYYLVSKQPQV